MITEAKKNNKKTSSQIATLRHDGDEALSKITDCYFQCAEKEKLDNDIVNRIIAETLYIFRNGGISNRCFGCGLTFERHHVAGKNNSEITITLCTHCHNQITTRQLTWDSRWTSAANSDNVKSSFVMQGLQDLLLLKYDNTGIREYRALAYSLSKLVKRYRDMDNG